MAKPWKASQRTPSQIHAEKCKRMRRHRSKASRAKVRDLNRLASLARVTFGGDHEWPAVGASESASYSQT